MELFCVLTARTLGFDDVCVDLSALLTSFLVVAWFAAGLIGIRACQHFINWTSMVLHHIPIHAGDEQVATSCDHHQTTLRVRRDVEPARGRL
jgi:hypothetical protein